jgi:polyisoprenoid-binding protein YceI
MKKLALGLLTFLTLSASAVDLNLEESKIIWLGKKEIVDSKHGGFVKFKSGSLEMKDGKLVSGTVVVDMDSIQTTDEKLSPEWKQKLVGHLKNEDFFKVAEYPTSTFTTTSVKAEGKDKYKVTGKLKMLKAENSVDVVLTQKGKEFTGSLTIDRTKWDLRYGSNSFFDKLGDKAISNEITLELKLVTK